MTPHPGQSRPPVPVRTILAAIGLVLAAALALYLVVEKILAEHEHFPSAWPVNGGTGYRFASLVNGNPVIV